MSLDSVVIDCSFEDVVDMLHEKKPSELDAINTTFSSSAQALKPATLRWLTTRNVFVNVGLEAIEGGKCQITANHNSYDVKQKDIKCVADSLKKLMEKK